MNDIVVPKNFGLVSKRFANQPIPDDLGAGIVGGFGVVSIRGKAWRIKYRGEEQILMREDGDGAVSYIDAVILRAAPHLSKIFYIKGYIEGSQDRPDCFSTNGLTPDPASIAKQAPACAQCPNNAWGSKITPAGKPGKACSDSKRVAIVPLHDIPNEAYGGPMLLRIPPASLADVANYAQKMGSLGVPYYAIGTRISFDVNSEYPKLIFAPLRVLDDTEALMVSELRDAPSMGRILSEASEFVGSEPPQEQEVLPAPQPAAKAPAPKAPEPKPVEAAKPAPAAKASGFGAKQAPAPAPDTADPGEVPEALKRTAPAKAPKAKAADKPVAEDAPVKDFDDMLDNLLS